MRKLRIAKEHEAGFMDFLNNLVKGSPTLPKGKEEDLKKFKETILTLYKKLNNAYKLYFQGAVLKSKAPKDKENDKTPPATMKIDFIGNWKFKLQDDKTSLGQAIQSLYQFLSKLENVKYTLKEAVPEKKQEPEKKQGPEKKPAPEQKPEQKPSVIPEEEEEVSDFEF